MKKYSEDKTLSLLLSGKHPKAKEFAGKHVLVVENEILPLKRGKSALKDIEKLEKRYGKTPTIVYVPPLMGRLDCLETFDLNFNKKISVFSAY